MNVANEALRNDLKSLNIPYWRIAEKLGIHEVTFVRWMRQELSADTLARVRAAIAEITESK